MGELPRVPDATRVALLARGLPALADELVTLRAAGSPRLPFVWRSLASATDVDVVRLRPPREAPREAASWPLELALVLVPETIDARLPPRTVSVPREALARLVQPIVAGLLVDEGRARDLGEAEPLVLAAAAAPLVDPRIDAALEERPLLATRGAFVCGVRAVRGAAAISWDVAAALGSGEREAEEIVLHLPLGQEAIEECRSLLADLPLQP